MQKQKKLTEEGKEQIAQKTSCMQCEECGNPPKDKIICFNCFANKSITNMWELEKLQRVKQIIDEILKLDRVENGKANPYNPNDYAHLFDVFDNDQEKNKSNV